MTEPEVRPVWVNDCISEPDKVDPFGVPQSDLLRIGWDIPKSQRRLFVKFAKHDWPATVISAKLRLFCLPSSRLSWEPALWLGYAGREWVAPAPDPDHWRNWCSNDLPGCEMISGSGGKLKVNTWCEMDLAREIFAWATGTQGDFGLWVETDDMFSWADMAGPLSPLSDKRPRWEITYRTNLPLRLPLPAGRAWLLTTEAGGGDCASTWVDPYHTGSNYYSLDFAPSTVIDGLRVAVTDVAVLAAADGKVSRSELAFPPGPNTNGWFVVIDHEAYSTRYLHLASQPLVKAGDRIKRGQPIGIMGSSGSDAVHLHFGVRFNNSGAENVSELKLVTLEGRPLKDFKIHCIGNNERVTFYMSSNVLVP